MKNLFKYLKIVVSLSLITGLLYMMRDKLPEIFRTLLYCHKPLILLSLFIYFVGLVLQAYRLKFLLDSQNVTLGIKDVLCLTFVGLFFNNFLPTTVGGDVVKAYYASNATGKKLETFASVFMDRMLGLVTLMWIAIIVLVIRWEYIQNKVIVLLVGGMFLLSNLFIIAVLNRNVAKRFKFLNVFFKKRSLKETMQRFYEAANCYKRHRLLLTKALVLSLVAQLLCIVMSYFSAKAIYSNVPFVILLVTIPAMSAISMLPSINGLGLREGSIVYFLSDIMGKEKAFAMSLIWLGMLLLASILGGIIFLIKKDFRNIQIGKI